ncbi:MAG: SCO family protein [Deltaproteobacteria bacterium]|nr:SCO family protein [Deltaproteobacteria bacterium]
MRAAARRFFSSPVSFLLLVAVLATPLLRSLRAERPVPPVLLELPEFRLTSERGGPFGRADLLGRAWVADFVFLACPSVCPRLTSRMKALQEKLESLGDRVRLVTFTVDPENDTPEKLAEYARAHGANPEIWTFLTGPSSDVEKTVVGGFKIAMGKEPTGEKGEILQIFHGEQFVLVDQAGNIRGYYRSDDQGQADLVRDIKLIMR